MENRWASPEGYEPATAPHVKYRIRDHVSGQVVERLAGQASDNAVRGGRFFLSLSTDDQPFANAITEIIQRACSYFRTEWTPLDGVPDVIVTDDEVRARIARLDAGENAREAERMHLKRYPLTDLPWDQQRALVEQIERLKREWAFEIVGEISAGEARAIREAGWRHAAAAAFADESEGCG